VPVRTGLREFALTLSEPVGATIATPTVMGKVLSDALPDPGPNAATILVSDISVVEGSAGLTTARFTVQLASAVSSPVTVAWATADGTATAPADYIAASGALTFAPGETAKSVDVAVMADRQFEFDERFTLVLGNATNARIGNSAASCRVINDDAAPVDRRRTTGH
jgi:chitinase